MIVRDEFIQKAEACKPELLHRTYSVQGDGRALSKGDTAVFDFGTHLTGYVTFVFSYEGHHPDAPVVLKLQFAENRQELSEDVSAYKGWISTGWIQEETVRVDLIPGELKLPRRYAFRYVRAQVLDISSRFSLRIGSVSCDAVTSADERLLKPCTVQDEELQAIDAAACRTLKECMQDVFEDGPKRDRRLWLGDLRLQALANAVTFRQFDLVKRCLYLFAGALFEDGRLSACVFTEPAVEADDTYMLDYALLFAKALEDYWQETKDLETVKELFPVVKDQFRLAEQFFNESGLIRLPDIRGFCFIDWNLTLHKQVCAQGVWLYCEEAAENLAVLLGEEEFLLRIREKAVLRRKAAEKLYDPEKQLFVSGEEKQVSMAGQVWAVLGGFCKDPMIFHRAMQAGALKMVSPYMYHYYLEALKKLGQEEEVFRVIRSYWGGMLKKGADTFWELYDPEDPDGSPYGGTIVNSYCHAWSCTPVWFIRKEE